MKSQFIEVKVCIEIKTDEEISYTEAERLAIEAVRNGFSESVQIVDIRT